MDLSARGGRVRSACQPPDEFQVRGPEDLGTLMVIWPVGGHCQPFEAEACSETQEAQGLATRGLRRMQGDSINDSPAMVSLLPAILDERCFRLAGMSLERFRNEPEPAGLGTGTACASENVGLAGDHLGRQSQRGRA